ncbi:MAG TPA: alpha/beta fold hydrolase [Pseudonocardiaceae bacterium]|nr:alpha/beta fold hydrolase [Pseudonocardiaceae bacterium]
MSIHRPVTSWGRRPFALSAAILIATAGLVCAASPASATETTTCRNVSVPVSAAGQSGDIAATLCVPPNATAVQLLIHGWTYDRNYWDLPYQPDTYSYVRAANRDGYATLDIDRLGDGQSSHPLSAFDTFYADVSTVHQTVQALRSGQLGQQFQKVVEVGHSLGSLVTMTEAGLYKDADAIITTGIAHSLNYVNVVSKIIADDYPAAGDPKFSASGLDVAYLTSDPGTRGGFYNTADTDPNVIATDEQLKQTGNLVELATLAAYNVLNVDRTLNIPVDEVVGAGDPFICGLLGPSCSSSAALAAFERPFYGPNATVVGYLAPNSGHDLQLEPSAPTTNAQMLAFSDNYIGHGAGATGTAPGTAPAVPTPPTPAPSAASTLTNALVVNAVEPVVATIQQASDVVPGLGGNTDPIPDMSGLLAPVGNLVDQLVGTFPEGLLGGI